MRAGVDCSATRLDRTCRAHHNKSFSSNESVQFSLPSFLSKGQCLPSFFGKSGKLLDLLGLEDV